MNPDTNAIYPARVLIKVIMSAKETEEENRRRIETSIEPLGYTPSSFSSRLSGKGRWMSLSFFTEIDSSPDLERLYAALIKVPGTRMVL